MARRLQQEVFPDLTVGLLHGRLSFEEKDAIMRRFKAGEIHILVSTTVIEVGIDVPNASVMLIEHADRFGLSQLHQLRGRVGPRAVEVVLHPAHRRRLGEDARRRIDALVGTNDGFRIAEVDLELRGPGEFFGTRQSGLPEFRVADLLRDAAILEEARREAMAIVARRSGAARFRAPRAARGPARALARQAPPRLGGLGSGPVRVIAGALKGRRLITPRGHSTRPTADQVRIALMDTLMPHLPDSDVLDLFAGGGGVGIEALSRGAARVTFVERDRRAAHALRQNLEPSTSGRWRACW